MSELAKLLGENIREKRKQQGISQEHLAELAGIDRSYMSRIERGIVQVTVEKAYQIAQALDLEVVELLPSVKTSQLNRP